MTAMRELAETDMHREGFERWAIDKGIGFDEWYGAWLGWQAALRHRDEQEKQE